MRRFVLSGFFLSLLWLFSIQTVSAQTASCNFSTSYDSGIITVNQSAVYFDSQPSNAIIEVEVFSKTDPNSPEVFEGTRYVRSTCQETICTIEPADIPTAHFRSNILDISQLILKLEINGTFYDSCNSTIAVNVAARDVEVDPTQPITQQQLNNLNPLYNQNNSIDTQLQLLTPRGIISRVLTFAFPIAGLILFIMIIWGGFETIGQAGSKKSIDAGKQRITNALIGFVLLFSAYWIVQILEAVFNITIL